MNRRFDADRIIAMSAMLIGLGSLVTFAYQAKLMREAQRASVLPYLYIALSSNERGVHILLTNSGIGPALVDDVRIHYEGRDIPADPFDFFISLKPQNKTLPLDVDRVQRGRLIPAGTTVAMIGIADQKFLTEFLRLFEIAEVPRAWYTDRGVLGGEKAVIDITFSSVYGERWRVRSDRIVPEKL
jgi:hypothetical protein